MKKKTVFVRNKPIIKTFLASNHCIQLKYKSINNIAFFGEKVISSESGEKYAQIKHLLRTLIWTKSNGLKLKIPWWCICFLQTNSFSLHKMLTEGLEWCGLLVYYCDVFISCLDSHSDGTHSLQKIHCRASDVMLNFSKSVPINKQMKLDHVGWPVCESILSRFSVLDEQYL